MNIREAKNYIKDTVSAYLKKDEFGDYRIPVEKQRPIFLLGSPGIGKTAIMSQIANELNIALVSYSMTHHTRQSALGLPFIQEKTYEGRKYSVSEYTMSEIIAGMYDTMEESGIREGILFLDEINCVSETLYPSMLLFLQYKVFGKHAVPPGWVIVTAGNPPEYNRAVREFDVVTLDRMKVLKVEADYPAWAAYASERAVHGAVTGFLDSSRDSFYKVETTACGKTYVTGRGWEDLSDMIKLYEEDKKSVNETLISQYITDEKTIKDFAAYYDLYCKYKKQYDIEALFTGELDDETVKAAREAPVDERLALVGLVSDTVRYRIRQVLSKERQLRTIRPDIASLTGMQKDEASAALYELSEAVKADSARKDRAGSLSSADRTMKKYIAAFYTRAKERVDKGENIKDIFNESVMQLKADTDRQLAELDCMFSSIGKIFGDESNEMLVTVTQLTLNPDTSEFLSNHMSDSYVKHSAVLKVDDRSKTLRQKILELDEL
ncbi:MAG: AAA family ATPase [Lachnospiraceae bacterium]|nr:AAA family ATPase [Lachnospiraceae bacterium]